MFGSTMALLTRSLRIDARLLQAHFFRQFFVGLTLLLVVIAGVNGGILGAPGLAAFRLICYLDAVFITLAGMSYFATPISEEKDESTLSLLMMTGISPVSLLLGKSTSRLISASLAVLVQYPFTLLAMALGGILPGQIAMAYVALTAYLILVANLGLLCSVCCRTSHQASNRMVRLLGLFFVGVPLARWCYFSLIGSLGINPENWLASAVSSLFYWLSAASVFKALEAILGTGFIPAAADRFQVWSNVVGGFAFFGLAWATFEHCIHREQISEPGGPRSAESRRNAKRTRKRAWRNALVWKDSSFVARGRRSITREFALNGALCVGIGLVIVGIYIAVPNFGNPSVGFSTRSAGDVSQQIGGWIMTLMCLILATEAEVAASRVFSHEVREKTLPLLAILPVSRAWLYVSKIAGCLLRLAPAASYFTVGALGCYLSSPDEFHLGARILFDSDATWLVLWLAPLCLHLTAYLSLRINHGAIPLALALMIIACLVVQSVANASRYATVAAGYYFFEQEWVLWLIGTTSFELISLLIPLVWLQGLLSQIPWFGRKSRAFKAGAMFVSAAFLYFLSASTIQRVPGQAVRWLDWECQRSLIDQWLTVLEPLAPIAWLQILIARRLRFLAGQ